ncbi:kinesin-like protein KIN-7G [Heracleum sosnowskyi]|uniref:Kinesin-like protein n=1 Tax=Heracleum sosnowskyi TaxID=360622 RepID=A0AAD8M362_9APIA|nr:kinesin-like protein KIN-7G [Heracleum sosnowskyi]
MGASDVGEEVGMAGGGHEEKIFVTVRLRPLNRKEIARNDVSDWDCINGDTVIYRNASVSMPDRSMYPSAYTFDKVFGVDCSTRQVYKEGAKEVALSVLTGINSSVFAYGQTSSGKTFTMTGITEYTISDIYDYIQKHTEREFHLKFSAMEIYNESVRDLLSTDNTPLRLLDDPERGTIVEKLTEETLRDWDHIMELLSICEAQRQIGETSLNEMSSRSHQIIRMTVESCTRELLSKDNSSTLVASVNFVDLAGSERASQSLSAGTRLKEGCHINRSLLTLGTVIRKLSKGRNSHVPFRDSKLTRILQSSLGGNARTAIICTMSPARGHVEQSRNTLLFASCAKEVSTNAQVNVIISDKALVKHLQRELTRLESELSTGSTYVASKFSALLREKELQIEKLEREVKDLTLQRDSAKSQIQEMLRCIGNEGHPSTRVVHNHYPHLRVQESPDAGYPVQNNFLTAVPHSMDVSARTLCTSPFSDGQSISTINRNYVNLPGSSEELHLDPCRRLLTSTSQLTESDLSQDLEDYDGKSNCTSEDICKEVRCIETEDFSKYNYLESSHISKAHDIGISATIASKSGETANEEWVLPESKSDEVLVSLPSKEETDIAPSLKVNREAPTVPWSESTQVASPYIEDSESKCIYDNPSPEKRSPSYDLVKEFSKSRSLSSTTSRSCESGILATLSSPRLQEAVHLDDKPPNGSEGYYTQSPHGSQTRVSRLSYVSDDESSSSNGSQSSNKNDIDIGLDTQEQGKVTSETISNGNACIAKMEVMSELHNEHQGFDTLANETKAMSNECLKSVKDVGLDPMEFDLRSPSNWPSEFKRLQREIIELWHTCNVSLVHRTHFFLLFNGDPTDSIYMEVELRRLSFLKETFSQGNQTVEDGRTLTTASSLKALRHERHMLSIQMHKQLPQIERKSLYLKWNIPLNGKHRRVQLANRLWTDSGDLDHIADSAFVVAKLIGLTELGKASKEMFSLKFAPWSSRRSYSVKRSLISIL